MNYLLQNKVNYLPDPEPVVVIWTLSNGIRSYHSGYENIIVEVYYGNDDSIWDASTYYFKYVYDRTHLDEIVDIQSQDYIYRSGQIIYRQSMIINIILSFKCKDITKIKDGDTIDVICTNKNNNWTHTYQFPVQQSYINTFNIVDCIPNNMTHIYISIKPVYDKDIFEIIYNDLGGDIPKAPLFQCL